jgi:hypothetical protein
MTNVSLDLYLSGTNRTVSMTWRLSKDDLRTMTDHSYSVINVGHLIADIGHSIVQASHLISNSPHTLANRMCGLQILGDAHPCLLMCQFV